MEAFLRRSKDRVFVSVLSIGEVRKGIALMASSNRRALLEEWLDTEIMPWLGDRVLPVSLRVAERWGDLAAQLKIKGKPRPVVDALLAATAFEHDLIGVRQVLERKRTLSVESVTSALPTGRS
ncbi:MAG: PIN domain-containing protein [Bryobacterales bacterium]|nr:PIN domain-containing protein [Bryobacterales bacterium]